MEKIKVGIIGATGYGGRETIRLLLKHPQVEIPMVSADDSFIGTKITDTFPEFLGMTELVCEQTDPAVFCKKCDIVLLATPNAVAMELTPTFLDNGLKVIDYSGDFRIKDLAAYEKAYSIKHKCPKLLKKTVYGMPELYADEIKGADLISNPGCYPTSIILALAPLCIEHTFPKRAVAVSITGTSGAGRKGLVDFIYSEIEGTIKPYKVGVHQHEPEINEKLSFAQGSPVEVTFAPQVGPFSRGILSTITFRIKTGKTIDDLLGVYQHYYKDQPFIRLMDKGKFPELKNVVNTNYCDIGLFVKEDGTCIVFSAIDNLLKGLSGQAVQNMNLMFGLDETIGIL